MESEQLWLRFIKSGSVKNYLDYCRAKNNETSQEVYNAAEDNDRRNNHQRNEYR